MKKTLSALLEKGIIKNKIPKSVIDRYVSNQTDNIREYFEKKTDYSRNLSRNESWAETILCLASRKKADELLTFPDETCQVVLSEMNFDENIEDLAICRYIEYLIACEKNVKKRDAIMIFLLECDEPSPYYLLRSMYGKPICFSVGCKYFIRNGIYLQNKIINSEYHFRDSSVCEIISYKRGVVSESELHQEKENGLFRYEIVQGNETSGWENRTFRTIDPILNIQ